MVDFWYNMDTYNTYAELIKIEITQSDCGDIASSLHYKFCSVVNLTQLSQYTRQMFENRITYSS